MAKEALKAQNAQTRQKRSQMVKNGPNVPKGPEWSKTVKIARCGPKWPKILASQYISLKNLWTIFLGTPCIQTYLLLYPAWHSNMSPSKNVLHQSDAGRRVQIPSKYFHHTNPVSLKHCQRHNGPEGWVHITSYYTNLDQTIPEFWSSINFQISNKHQYLD